MCGRFAQFSPVDILKSQFEIDALTCEVRPSFNIAPTNEVIALIRQDGIRLGKLRWGLVPPWMKDQEKPIGIINARSETLSEKPAFKKAFKERRCLILADGYFEWKKEGNMKIPYYFFLPSKTLFGFAGLWESWKDKEGKNQSSCAIITGDAKGAVGSIHTRMPLILSPKGAGLWLDSGIRDADILKGVLSELLNPDLDFHRVSERVNAVSSNGPSCIEKVL
ncbi:MAG: SOS response-associated peptidase [Proteobacteria bacterium]|nr:SOS response-associated peptidase [Pseudomonadota bacterium]